MKRIISVSLAMLALTATSCKKDWTCQCTTGNNTTITNNEPIKNQTRKDAKTACENGSGSTLGITTTCKLK